MIATCSSILPISLSRVAETHLTRLSRIRRPGIWTSHCSYRPLSTRVDAALPRTKNVGHCAGPRTATWQIHSSPTRHMCNFQSRATFSPDSHTSNVEIRGTLSPPADGVIIKDDDIAEEFFDTDGDASVEPVNLRLPTDSARVPSQPGRLDPGLYVVGSPIGNLEDITLRALRVLRQSDLVLAEDTRHSAKLLRSYDINTPMLSYHEHNAVDRRFPVLNRIRGGQAVALISDAGMPGVSDPGADLVAVCVEAGLRVVPIPGPCAVITAIAAGGMPVGFLPDKSGPRLARLSHSASQRPTQVLYCAPHKLRGTLRDCCQVFGGYRFCVVARELTKVHEEFWRGTLEAAVTEWETRLPRGEFTLLIQGVKKGEEEERPAEEEIEARLTDLLNSGCSTSQAIRQVVDEMGTRRNVVYRLALKVSAGLNEKCA